MTEDEAVDRIQAAMMRGTVLSGVLPGESKAIAQQAWNEMKAIAREDHHAFAEKAATQAMMTYATRRLQH